MKFHDIAYRTNHLITRTALGSIKIPEPPALIGQGMVRRFPEVMMTTGVSNVLIISGKHLVDAGVLDDFLDGLLAQGINFSLFTDRGPDPTLEEIAAALSQYYHDGCDSIVGFGGGSALDCAKITAAKVTNDIPIERMKGLFKLRHKLPPFFAIPTTAGSGSEASIAAVITNAQTHDKFSIADTKLIPLATVLDAELTLALSPQLTAEGGMDALTHAIEAYIGWYDTPYVKEKATAAVKTILEDLEAAYDDGHNMELRQSLLVASHNAGLAFTRAYIGYTHAIAHALGGAYGLPHGQLCATVLPHVLHFSKEKASAKLAELAYTAGLGDASLSDSELAELLIDKIRQMNIHMGIPRTIDALKVEDVPDLARHILAEANPTYPVPRIMNYNQCVEILGKLLTD